MDADSDTSSLLTLSTSLREALYRYEGGRRHQASSSYAWPCDDAASRFEILVTDALGKTYTNGLYWEPTDGDLDEVLSGGGAQSRLLDLGSGTTASWAISMAEQFPHVECIGVDLVPTDLDYLPSNLAIEVYDLMDGVPFPDDYFSLIHCRMGGGGESTFFDNPNRDFLADLCRALRPGGVLLLEDLQNWHFAISSRYPDDAHLSLVRERHESRVQQMAARYPLKAAPNNWASNMADAVRQTDGFATPGSVQETSIELPIGVRCDGGPLELQIGALCREAWITGWSLQGAALGMDEKWILREREKDELALPAEDVGLFLPWVVVWAVKVG